MPASSSDRTSSRRPWMPSWGAQPSTGTDPLRSSILDPRHLLGTLPKEPPGNRWAVLRRAADLQPIGVRLAGEVAAVHVLGDVVGEPVRAPGCHPMVNRRPDGGRHPHADPLAHHRAEQAATLLVRDLVERLAVELQEVPRDEGTPRLERDWIRRILAFGEPFLGDRLGPAARGAPLASEGHRGPRAVDYGLIGIDGRGDHVVRIVELRCIPVLIRQGDLAVAEMGKDARPLPARLDQPVHATDHCVLDGGELRERRSLAGVGSGSWAVGRHRCQQYRGRRTNVHGGEAARGYADPYRERTPSLISAPTWPRIAS